MSARILQLTMSYGEHRSSHALTLVVVSPQEAGDAPVLEATRARVVRFAQRSHCLHCLQAAQSIDCALPWGRPGCFAAACILRQSADVRQSAATLATH